MLRNSLKKLKKKNLFFNFKNLSGGILFSQIILFSSAPVITRLYDPIFFGIYALFFAISQIFAASVTCKYDTAIVVTQNTTDVNKLFLLSIFFSLFFSFSLFMIFFFGMSYLKKILNNEFYFFLFLLPLFIFFQSIIEIIKSLANRYQLYNVIAKSLIIKSLIFVVVAIIFGLLEFSSIGLFIAEFVSLIVTIFFLFFANKPLFNKIKWKFNLKLLEIAKKYKKYPFALLSSSIIDRLVLYLPIFFLNKYFGETYAGYYALCLKVFFNPLSFISGAIATINLRKITLMLKNKSNITIYFFKLSFVLLIVVTIQIIILKIFGPYLFTIIFGQKWTIAGEFMSILITYFGLMFIVSALSTILIPTKKYHLYSIWNIVSFFTIFNFFYFFSKKFQILELLNFFVILQIILYSLYYYFIYIASKSSRKT
jgi:O-antigen/teichoic acid export membrane protein